MTLLAALAEIFAQRPTTDAEVALAAARDREMRAHRGPICPLCGHLLLGVQLCEHHTAAYSEGWAASNRAMCSFFHRGRR